MSLVEWLRNGWLAEHRSSLAEVNDALALVDRDLADAQVAEISSDWRFAIAYNAVLQSASIALAVAGYRASREGHHYRTLLSLRYTVGLDRKDLQSIDAFR